MDIILHIGTEKTGTSTIQSTIKSNEGWLAENRILVPSSLRPNGLGDNQIVLPAMFCEAVEKSKLRARAGQHQNETDDAFDKRISTAFEEEIGLASRRGINRVLVSSEHLSSRLRTPEDIQTLADWLAGYGRVTKIIVYLRRQDQFLVSSYSTALKSGRIRPFNIPGANWAKHFYDYQNLLTLWGEAFGYNVMIVRPFERTRFVNQDLIDDFVFYAGLEAGNPVRTNDKNLSIDPKSLAVLLRYNQWASNTNYDKAEEGRSRLVSLLEERSSSERMALSADVALAFNASYEEGNSWVANNFMEEGESLFTEEIDPSQTGNMPPNFSVSDLFPLFMYTLLRNR